MKSLNKKSRETVPFNLSMKNYCETYHEKGPIFHSFALCKTEHAHESWSLVVILMLHIVPKALHCSYF